jgi:hypothetical protein
MTITLFFLVFTALVCGAFKALWRCWYDDRCNFSPVFFFPLQTNLVVSNFLQAMRLLAWAMVEEHPAVWPHMQTGPTMVRLIGSASSDSKRSSLLFAASFFYALHRSGQIMFYGDPNQIQNISRSFHLEMWKWLRECFLAIRWCRKTIWSRQF